MIIEGTSNYKIKQMEQKPESEWIRIPDAHEPLITKLSYGTKKQKRKRTGDGAGNHKHLPRRDLCPPVR